METTTNRIVSEAFQNNLLEEKQAAQFLQVEPGTLSVWRCTGRYKIPFIKVGRLVRYRQSDLEAWLESRTLNNGGE
jgi:excisionase family DNA binding protein